MTTKRWRDHQYKVRRHHIEALDREVDRQRLGVASRANAGTTRASILLASAGVIMSVEASKPSPGPFEVVSICLAAIAGILGILVLLPRGGPENGVEDLKDEIWPLGRDRATYIMFHRKLEILTKDESLLRQRSSFASWGFGAFGLSLFSLVAGLLCSSN